MKNTILGLDLGTNSIGWALVEHDFEEKESEIIDAGSRIIPMSQDVLGKFDAGQSISQTAERTKYRSVRRLRQRYLLRRERLHRVLNILNALPFHYAAAIDFKNKKGKFLDGLEVKLNYKKNGKGEYDFIFKGSFNKMLSEFKKNYDNIKIPYDWTIYFLRKKALEEKISLQELAWIILNFNQKRGYYQLRGEEEEEDKTKSVEYYPLKVVGVEAEEPNYKNDIWYNVKLENGWVYRRKSKNPLNDWIGKIKEFIVTTQLDKNGNPKEDVTGNPKRSFRAPDENDWTLLKTKTQKDIEKYNVENNTIGVASYIINALLINPKQKIRGKLIKTIERKYYKNELAAIIRKQKEYHPELQNKELFQKCVVELYPNNFAQQQLLTQKDFVYLFTNDIVFYQRPLKSKKSLIDECKLEYRVYKNKEGKLTSKGIKVIAKSHPLYQEFRLWQFISNLKILKRKKEINGRVFIDYDVTTDFFPSEDSKVKLFEFLNQKEKITQKQFLASRELFGRKFSENDYRWNYVEDKEYPLNETRAMFITKFSKHKDFDWNTFLSKENEISLWHIVYSVSDKKEFEKAIENSKVTKSLPLEIKTSIKKIKPFKKDFGAYSEKAIKKLLPLMRMGKYWDYDSIDDKTKERIQKIITGEYDEKIRDRVREKAINLTVENSFKGLPLWLASYIVYDKHSERGSTGKWKTPKQINNFLKEFKQHGLRNPIVEQVITETLRLVHDVWEYYGQGKQNFFDEIHIELGREMKNPANQRKIITERVSNNQNTNQRIRILLREFKNQNMEGVLPESPNQQEKLRIFENDILARYSEKDLEKEEQDGIKIAKVIKSLEPTSREIEKYKLWLEQKYRSPYTGKTISLSNLFTADYEIEHIIPQARYFDNSFNNKVICEAEVNRFKDRMTAYEMISKKPGQIIDLGQGKSVKLFLLDEYQKFVTDNFVTGSKKQKLLLSEDIPEGFISRQLNDTRYISKVVKSLLSNIVREDGEQEDTSKNIVSITGGITDRLKKDWGLNDKWNEIILPRFKRLNEITNTNLFTYFNEKYHKEIPSVPLDLKKNFSKKRIDHRHHAMDALTIAVATKDHVNYLNNAYAKSDNQRYDLRNKLCFKKYTDNKENYKWLFYLPWKTFPVDVKNILENTVVSFKQNLRVINNASNKYQKWVNESGVIKKKFVQQKGRNWAIRKPLHKETVYAKVKLRKVKSVSINTAIDGVLNSEYICVDKQLSNKIKQLVNKGYNAKSLKKYFKTNVFRNEKINKADVYYFIDDYAAVRKTIDETFKSVRWIKENVTDTGIQKILINHLGRYNEIDNKGEITEHPELAFSHAGIIDMNNNIVELNDERQHQPIYKARVYETLGNKFAVGVNDNKATKFVEAAKGTNLYFAVYSGVNKKGEQKRVYDTIPLNVVIERQKQGLLPVPKKFVNEKDKTEAQLLFYLSPNDLVYVPTDEEMQNIDSIDFKKLTKEQNKRIYRMVSSSGTQCFFVRNNIAVPIVNKIEFSPLNKTERDINNEIMIKERCIKLKVNRLGKVSKAV
ncbi:MAG: type II CRISPR RNA-guided endonuclease Cas9 [Bacteroidetes bacterium]|nr:MAG: type II CRISPR RNA-guided endonuclease Cas9 [Bacteroidota bacterium]